MVVTKLRFGMKAFLRVACTYKNYLIIMFRYKNRGIMADWRGWAYAMFLQEHIMMQMGITSTKMEIL